MSVPFSGAVTKSGGVHSAIIKLLKSVNLKPVSRIEFKFDPFHERTEEIRNFMFHFNTKTVTKTNLQCSYKTKIVCDRSDPTVTFKLANGENVIFKSANLTVLDMIRLFNQHISVLAPKEDVQNSPVATKSSADFAKRKSKK